MANDDAYYIWQKQTVFSDEANMFEFGYGFFRGLPTVRSLVLDRGKLNVREVSMFGFGNESA